MLKPSLTCKISCLRFLPVIELNLFYSVPSVRLKPGLKSSVCNDGYHGLQAGVEKNGFMVFMFFLGFYVFLFHEHTFNLKRALVHELERE